MFSAHADDESIAGAVDPMVIRVEDTDPDLPAFVDARHDDADEHEHVIRPLAEVTLDDSGIVVAADDGETDHSPILGRLAGLLGRDEPLVWVFAGTRFSSTAEGDGRLLGEWFAEEWRADSGRATDLIIDATWPNGTLADLKSHLRSRVVRRRPDVVVLCFEGRDASAGVEGLPQFERRLVCALSVLAEIGAEVVLLGTEADDTNDDFDLEIYTEALHGVARERGVAQLIVPRHSGTGPQTNFVRTAAFALCSEALRAMQRRE